MNTDLSLITLIVDASLVVKLVMLILLVISLYSWTLIFDKFSQLKAARRAADKFESEFWSSKQLGDLYRDKHTDDGGHGMISIFLTGFKQFARLKKSKLAPALVLEEMRRAMRIPLAREVDSLEKSLSFLATAGSTSPYIGLFGTVWGHYELFSCAW